MKKVIFVFQEENGFTFGSETFLPERKEELLGVTWVREGASLNPLEEGEEALFIIPPDWVEKFSQ